MKVATALVVAPMRVEHIPVVSAIERLSFPQPWPQNAYRREILENRMAHYIVARLVDDSAGTQASAPEKAKEQEREREKEKTSPTGRGNWFSRLLRPVPEPPSPELEAELRSIVGYAGIWVMTDEAHVTTIATHPNVRGRGVGELLLLALIHRAIEVGARWMTLEVRASNAIAQGLYRKYTFKEMGVRRRYYSDNGEDALVMWTDALDSDTFQKALDQNERKLAQRLDAEVRLGDHVWSLGGG